MMQEIPATAIAGVYELERRASEWHRGHAFGLEQAHTVRAAIHGHRYSAAAVSALSTEFENALTVAPAL